MRTGKLTALIAAAGLADAPLTLAIRSPAGNLDWTQHAAPADRFYGASLAKQVTGAAIAALVRRGLLDVDAPIGAHLPDLPTWRDIVTARHLLHHLGGLPQINRPTGPGIWTNQSVLAQLRDSPDLVAPPGTGFVYSNAGYICLAAIIERITGQTFADFVQQTLFEPLGLTGIGFSKAPDFPQLAGMGDVLPLTLGGGGIWTTSAAFADWLDHQNRDTLGVAALVQQPGRLADGTESDYGWGIGLRTLHDHPLYIHGGGWPGAFSKAARCPAFNLSIVALTSAEPDTAVIALVDALLAEF